MAGNIFISYRRSDSIKDARALYERLVRDFGEDRIFVDLEGIDPGDDFVVSLDGQLAQCEVLLALMGRNWAHAVDDAGRRRLDDPHDFVRIEVRSALQRDIKIFPVLIDGAEQPRADELPDDLRPLVRRQAVSLDYAKFDGDVARLSRAIRKEMDARGTPALPVPAPVPPKPPVSEGGSGVIPSVPWWRRAGWAWAAAGVLTLVLASAALTGGPAVRLLRVGLGDVKYIPVSREVRLAAENSVKRLTPVVHKQFGLMLPRSITPWELAQASVALPRSELIAPEAFIDYVRGNAHPACSCWTELLDKPDDAKGVFISGWMLAALARYRVPATPAELSFLLDNQNADGWWPIFPVKDAPQFASAYATAWAILGLYQQKSHGMLPAASVPAVDQAISRGAAWLLAHRQGARWKFYPLDVASKTSVGVSGTVLYTLHAVEASGLEAVDQAWLDSLPQDAAGESDTEYRVVPTQPVPSTNAIEMIRAPWALAATAEAYPSGTLLQRAEALRWTEELLSDPRIARAAEVETRSWWRAELLFGLRHTLP
jgi:hypothetical protein